MTKKRQICGVSMEDVVHVTKISFGSNVLLSNLPQEILSPPLTFAESVIRKLMLY